MKGSATSFDASSVYGLILAGGQSSRLFPFNKVLSSLTGSDRSLLQQAFDRLAQPLPRGAHRTFLEARQLFVLTAASSLPALEGHLPIPPGHVLADPARRGTWPAILWAMAHVRRENPEATLAVITGDHFIGDIGEFREAAAQAMALAQNRNAIAVIGVQPTDRPEAWLGFGTLRGDKGAKAPGSSIREFEEKPSLGRAQTMIRAGGWVWNAGMFFFRLSVAEALLKTFQPEMDRIYQAMAAAIQRENWEEAKSLFTRFPARIPHPLQASREVDNTIDYAIMTPLVARPSAEGAAYVTAACLTTWKDIGQWDALTEIVRPDRQGNVSIGDVKASRTVRQCILAADRGFSIDAADAEGLVVAVSESGTLVMARAEQSHLKDMVSKTVADPHQKRWEEKSSGCHVDGEGRIVTLGVRQLDIHLKGKRLSIRRRVL